jgi:hypothetical protein
MEIQKLKKQETKKEIISVRATKKDKEWIEKNELSPSKIFDEALKEIKNKVIKDGN